MNNQILRAVLADYEVLRRQNEQEEARRRAEIEQRCPDLHALVQGRHDMIMASVRSGLSGTGGDPEARMRAYNEKIAALLQEKGYPADYLNPVCRCSKCQDTGFVYDENSLQKPCSCLLSAYQAKLTQADPAIDDQPSFERFDESRFPDEPLPKTDVTQREYMRLVRDKCLGFARQVPDGPVKTLLLHGGSGLGKTYLLRCVEKQAADRGVDTLYTTAYDLLMALKNAYFSRTGETASEYFDAELLLIDDLGMEPLMENITVEQIYNLINARLTRGLYTAVSTNLSRVELKEKYTERLSSRLLDTRAALAIPFLGRDIRLIK
ncbi:MAG: ATP-binding protein [Clostridia bacterium]|nr:ATP-binding protein [Clostridia bacterium]